MPHPPSWFDWLTVVAIFCGPIAALLAQRGLDRFREKKNRRFQLYTTLMSLRSDPLNPDHVKALNSLDAIFDGRGKDARVRDAWGRMLAHLGTDSATPNWEATLIDKRVDLYQAVGKAVGYDHTIEYIKTRLYAPTYFNEVITEQNQIRQGLAKALTGALKVEVAEPAPPAARGVGAGR
jgi:hypothetical protein